MNQNTFCKYCHRIPSQCGCTHPVKELTDEEIRKIALECDAYENDGGLITDDICIDKFARAILRKAQEK